MNARSVFLLTTVLLLSAAIPAFARTVWLDELDLSPIKQGWGVPIARQSCVKKPLTLAGKEYERGVGSHAVATIYIELDGQAKRFTAMFGVDDEAKTRGSITFKAYGDGKILFKTPVIKGGEAPQKVELDLMGIKQLVLLIGNGGDNVNYDHADLADAKFVVEGADPKITASPREEPFILTPKPSKEPRINGPRVAGVRPGSPFIFRIPTTGDRPMKFSVRDLPKGLEVNADTGIITGRIEDRTPKTYQTTLVAENACGKAERELRIAVGETLALTPPMGWNHWYAHYDRITDAMMREAADIMVSSGMADVGYQYVNIDDCWMNAEKNKDPKRVGPLRDAEGRLQPNSYFPDMKGLSDYIHSKGLRAGLYTSPGPRTCAGFAGAYEHEEQDARTFAEWGFDFLKYDWCSYGEIAKNPSLDDMKKPYILIGSILRKLDRDMVLNLCQYGMGDVWLWGEEVGGQCWRTAGDLGFELVQYHDVALRNAEHWQNAGPGSWNDPDYIQIGYPGDAATMGEPKPCPLTPHEQYSYLSLWALMASPIFFSGDMTRLDEFTLNVLCNPEVIDIDQDPLGVQGRPVVRREEDETEVWTKELEDGSVAVGLFNRTEAEKPVAVKWSEIGLGAKQRARDVWRQKDLGVFDNEFTAPVGRHGVVLLRVTPEK